MSSRGPLDSAPVVIGVRHHSPACARLVEHVIREIRPRFVLIEGPAEMNGRMEELLLGHELPIALYSYLSSAVGDGSRGAFSPFCDYSPEWVALSVAKEVGAESLFIDLPSYDPAFSGVLNRYSDRHLRASDRMDELCRKLGFEDTDSLWDHMFELPSTPALLEDRLHDYFVALRGDEPGGPRDEPREDFMARWMAHVMKAAAGAPVLVVCGGYHAPVLAKTWRDADTTRPELPPVPPDSRVGTYLVPYSFHRLDAFAGYQAGMPSPGYYQAVWTHGPREGADRMLRAATTRLRDKKQRVSAADLIGVASMIEGLTRIRGHQVPLRTDVLDGLAAALIKDAVSAPFPWTRRGPLASGTDPMLVEIVAAFSGERYGHLAAGTPRPPLVDDTYAALASVGIVLKRSPEVVVANLVDEDGKRRSRVLHRLRILGVPDFQLVRGPSFARTGTDLSERWQVTQKIETDASLIEAAAFGATLESAAHARLADRANLAMHSADLVSVLFDAARAGIRSLGAPLLAQIRTVVQAEPELSRLGSALSRLLGLLLHGELFEPGDRAELREVVRDAYERAAWLFEGLVGGDVPADAGHVDAVVAMRDVLRHAATELPLDVTVATDLARRRAADVGAPSYVRGAGLGLLAALDPEGSHADSAVRAIRAASRPSAIGDFLIGLFAVAREEVKASAELLSAIDLSISTMGKDDFFVAIPALRQAFAYFPPREKRDLARAVLALHSAADEGHDLLHLDAAPEVIMAAMKLDERAIERAIRFGLFVDAPTEEEASS